MAQKRLFTTKFWSDSYISNLDPVEKLLFFYFLMNEKATISGIYELPSKIMSVETGIEKSMIEKILKRFNRDKKIVYFHGHVIIKNFPKHQNLKSEDVKTGILRDFESKTSEIKQKAVSIGYPIDIVGGLSRDYLGTARDTKPNLTTTKPNLTKPISALPKDVVNYFFELKGWDNKEKDYYEKNKIIYTRYLKPAKQLLDLCDGNLEEAKECLNKLSTWADSRELGWSIETVFKKWYELDHLKPKEKKPFIDGRRAFQKENGKWYLIEKNGEIKEYVGSLKNIEYK